MSDGNIIPFNPPNRPPLTIAVEIEQDVLGQILLGADIREIPFLRPEHFQEPLHANLFSVMQIAQERFGSANAIVVGGLVKDKEAWSAGLGINLQTYLVRLATNTAGTGSKWFQQHARAIVEQSARVRLARECARTAEILADPVADTQKAVYAHLQALQDVTAEMRAGGPRKSSYSLGEAMECALEAAELAASTGNGLTGISWGLTDINRLTGGIQRRDLTLIAARPGMGKTTFATSVALKAAKSDHGVSFLSLEMDTSKLAARIISDALYDRCNGVPYIDLIRGTASPEEMALADETRESHSQLPIWIDDRSGLSMADIRIMAERRADWAAKIGIRLDLLIIDHLGLIRASDRYAGSKVNEIAELTAGLKCLARDLDVAVILLSQLNREVEKRDNRRPQLSDLRDSGAIEQDADMIAFLYRDAYYLERAKGAMNEVERADRLIECQHEMDFIIAKQRNGPLASIKLFAAMGCSAIRNAAHG